jgi:hypothetical protein
MGEEALDLTMPSSFSSLACAGGEETFESVDKSGFLCGVED